MYISYHSQFHVGILCCTHLGGYFEKIQVIVIKGDNDETRGHIGRVLLRTGKYSPSRHIGDLVKLKELDAIGRLLSQCQRLEKIVIAYDDDAPGSSVRMSRSWEPLLNKVELWAIPRDTDFAPEEEYQHLFSQTLPSSIWMCVIVFFCSRHTG